jgi:hypothetical protein
MSRSTAGFDQTKEVDGIDMSESGRQAKKVTTYSSETTENARATF